MQQPQADYAVKVKNLNFDYGGSKQVLFDMTFQLEKGARCILVGANGAGKSTLLRILSGKHMVADDAVVVLGRSPFHDCPKTLSFLGNSWTRPSNITSSGIPYQADLPVHQLISSAEGAENKERLNYILDLLDINVDWRMHEVSDGQRRRVQIMLGLLKPFDVLFLDEITVDLDVHVRKSLLEFLKQETEQRKATIIYATHIFDGLNEWATHLLQMSNGRCLGLNRLDDIPELVQLREDKSTTNSPLLRLVEKWIWTEVEEKRRLKRTEEAAKQAAKPTGLYDRLADKRHTDRFYNYWG